MTPAVATHNLRPLHTKAIIRVSLDGARDGIEIRRPSTSRFELMRRFVQGRIAAGAGVDSLGRIMGVIFAGARTLRALLAKNAKLFYSFDQRVDNFGMQDLSKAHNDEPGLRTARHSSSLR